MINIVIIGINGKMGSYVYRILNARDRYNVVAGVDTEQIFTTVPVFENLKEVLRRHVVDLVIDFSSPTGIKNLEVALRNEIKVITGTTGYIDQDREQLIDLAEKNRTSLIFVPNFAYGASQMYKILKQLNLEFNKKDLLEIHELNKKDKPSGTAKEYAKIMNIDVKNIQSIRLNDVLASHEAIFDTVGEKLIIRHEINHRDAFLTGLLKSMDLILGKYMIIRNFDEYFDELYG